MKWLVGFLLFCSAAFSWEFQDQVIEGYTFEWNRKENFQEASQVFVDSFMFAYRGFSPQRLGVESIQSFLEKTIAEELELQAKKPKDIHWLVAKKNGKIVGLLILELTDYPEVYGRQLAISPHHLRTGLGTLFADVTLKNLPKAKRFVVITRAVNQVSARFFESLGFKRSEYMHEGYDSSKYIGYEYIVH